MPGVGDGDHDSTSARLMHVGVVLGWCVGWVFAGRMAGTESGLWQGSAMLTVFSFVSTAAQSLALTWAVEQHGAKVKRKYTSVNFFKHFQR